MRRHGRFEPRRRRPVQRAGGVNLRVTVDHNLHRLGEGWLRQVRITRGWRYTVRIEDPYEPHAYTKVDIEVVS